ncbi:hypothetical protein ASE43_19780 [Lysobacter sp. Root983]|nr:hypothetical protein ASE43_19780 [Lysobacter sp. Root983]
MRDDRAASDLFRELCVSYEFWSFVGYIPALVSAGLTVAARKSWAVFATVGVALLIASTALAIVKPSLTVGRVSPICLIGYETWAVIACIAVSACVVGIWRHITRPGIATAVVATAPSFIALYMGAWIS